MTSVLLSGIHFPVLRWSNWGN